MLSLDVFLPRIMPQAISCPEPLAKMHLVDAAIEFCEGTGVVRHTTYPLNTVAGTATYDLDIPVDTELDRVRIVWLDRRPLSVLARGNNQHVSAHSPDVTTQPGSPFVVSVVEPNTITLTPPPSVADLQLVAHVSLRPKRSATKLDDSLYNRWLDAVVAGTLVRICSTPGQPYTDPNQVARYSAILAKQTGLARVEANRGQMGGPLSVQMHPIA